MCGAMPEPATLPRLAWLLGLGGLIPFVVATSLALAGPPIWQPATLTALTGYGAVILAFLGAVHWGFALPLAGRAPDGSAARLALGILPALIGWVALLLPQAAGLTLLAAGILTTFAAEAWAARRGAVAISYLRLRAVLSGGAAAALLAGAWAASQGNTS